MSLERQHRPLDTLRGGRTGRRETGGGLIERLSNEATRELLQARVNWIRRQQSHKDIYPLVKEAVNSLPPSNARNRMSEVATAMRTKIGEDRAWHNLIHAAVTNPTLQESLTKLENKIKEKTLQARVKRLIELDEKSTTSFVESTLASLGPASNAHTIMSEVATATRTNTDEDKDKAWRKLIGAAKNDDDLKGFLHSTEQRIRIHVRIGRIRRYDGDINSFVERALASLDPHSDAHGKLGALATALRTNTDVDNAWHALAGAAVLDPALRASLKQIAQDVWRIAPLQAQVKRLRHHKDIKPFAERALASLDRASDAYRNGKMHALVTALHRHERGNAAWHALAEAAVTDSDLRASLDHIEQDIGRSTLLQAQVERIRYHEGIKPLVEEVIEQSTRLQARLEQSQRHKDTRSLVERAVASEWQVAKARRKLSELAKAMRTHTEEDEAWDALANAAVTNPLLEASLDRIGRKIDLQAQVKRLRVHDRDKLQSSAERVLASLNPHSDAHRKLGALATALRTNTDVDKAWHTLTDAAVVDPALATSLDRVEHGLDWGVYY